MRLKTKLVLAISALVFLIAGTVSLVYVHQLIKAAVQQTYDTKPHDGRPVWYALQQAVGNRAPRPDCGSHPSGRASRSGGGDGQNDAQLQAAIDSVNRYSLTVYDITS